MWKTTTTLIAITLLLVTLGVVMLASTSPLQGETLFKDPNFFLKRQLAALALGLVGGYLAMRMDYHHWRSLTTLVGGFTVLLLVLVLVPGIGLVVNGSRRWLPLGPITMQPSELAKFALVLVMAWWMSRVQRKAAAFVPGMLAPGLLMGVFTGLVFLEPDYGTTILLGAVGLAILFAGGARFTYLAVAGVLGACGVGLAILQNKERMDRIFAFLNPEKFAKDEAFQLLNAIYAFVVGGGPGVGLGGSLQKRFYLPEAHTDFIFAIVGEELGLAASLAVVALFLAFFVCGLYVSHRSSDTFGRLTAFGITAMITLQAAINIGVVTGCLPTKGLPLPFISYGGTSLAMSLVMVGVLLNISIQSGGERGDPSMAVIKDCARRL
jgi:cell division protein FtsW